MSGWAIVLIVAHAHTLNLMLRSGAELARERVRTPHMAARSIASLTIAFGLVAIPVKLYSATVSSERLRFHLLHAKDGSRLKQQYVCVEEQEVVGRDEIVKGYEFAKDQYVMFTPKELQALEEAGTHSVDV